ncbi:nucleotidyltransferase family protein [Verrucosispora sp. FIM060022]|uniref:nucleotidyltransferase family protein n=1 Tax=Verrucosispora sp. FIM060022 TaxID=1479020 RepID=UPI00256F38B7|nr:nucleotidyltransferase family protein [Verrucosispora sp. FIM060022]
MARLRSASARLGGAGDPAATTSSKRAEYGARLPGQALRSGKHQPWEAKNQAAVHTWYPAKFGTGPVPPLRSIAEAVATWPEYATAVAIRLDPHDHIAVCAPHGLDDLLDGIWRPNPTRVSPETSRQRLARHRPTERWPRVRVIT